MAKPLPPISIRLDPETEERLRRLACETGVTLSSVVREAVVEYAAAQERATAGAAGPYDRLRHLIGVVDRQTDRSERTGERFRSVLKATGRARRPR